MRRRSWKALSVVVSLLAAAGVVRAGGEAVPVKIVGGVAVVRGAVKSPGGTLAAHFVLDLGSPEGLVLPPERAREIGAESGKPVVVTLAGEELRDVLVAEGESAEMVRRLTAEHATELEQVPAVGTLGLGAFSGKVVELDLAGRTLGLGGEMPASGEGIELEAGRPVFRVGDVRVGLGMLRHESLVSVGAASKLKVGRVGAAEVTFGGIDLLKSDAYRPSPMEGLGVRPPDLLMGVRLLGSFKVTVDPAGRKAVFERLRVPEGAAPEQAYFLAAERRDADGIAAFLTANADHRLASEAAVGLLELRANEAVAGEEGGVVEAARLVAKAFPAERRSRRLVAIVDDMLGSGEGRFLKVARKVLEVAAESAKDDLDSKAVYEIHARQGLVALRGGDLSEARRRLVSAAYGMPTDGRVNVWLGDLYRREGEPVRAWARYLEAALQPEPLAAALRGLDELNRDAAFRKNMGIGEVELMLEGRAPGFVPPRVRSEGDVAGAKLVEIFVSDAGGGSVGPQLAFDGLRRFYQGTPVVFLAHHFGPAGNTELAAERARQCGVRSLPAMVVDGKVVAGGAGGVEDAARLFEGYARAVGENNAHEGVSAVVRGGWDGGRLKATAEVKVDAGVEATLRARALVYERRVFAIGGNGVAMHYMAVRGVAGPREGWEVRRDQKFEIAAGAEEFVKKVDEEGERGRAAADHSQGRPSMRTTMPNVAECGVAVVVQEEGTGRVVGAAWTEPAGDGGVR